MKKGQKVQMTESVPEFLWWFSYGVRSQLLLCLGSSDDLDFPLPLLHQGPSSHIALPVIGLLFLSKLLEVSVRCSQIVIPLVPVFMDCIVRIGGFGRPLKVTVSFFLGTHFLLKPPTDLVKPDGVVITVSTTLTLLFVNTEC